MAPEPDLSAALVQASESDRRALRIFDTELNAPGRDIARERFGADNADAIARARAERDERTASLHRERLASAVAVPRTPEDAAARRAQLEAQAAALPPIARALFRTEHAEVMRAPELAPAPIVDAALAASDDAEVLRRYAALRATSPIAAATFRKVYRAAIDRAVSRK